MWCIFDNDCNSWVDVELLFDEATIGVALSSGVVTCSCWWDNGGGIISIRGEGGERFTGDKGVEKAASLSFWRSFAACKVSSVVSRTSRTTPVGVIGFISDSAAGAAISDGGCWSICWWWRWSEDSGLGNRSFVLGEQLTEPSTFTLDFKRKFDFRRNLEERLSDCEGLCKIDGLIRNTWIVLSSHDMSLSRNGKSG